MENIFQLNTPIRKKYSKGRPKMGGFFPGYFSCIPGLTCKNRTALCLLSKLISYLRAFKTQGGIDIQLLKVLMQRQ